MALLGHIKDLERKKFYNDGTIKIRNYRRGNSIDIKKTVVGASSAVKINFPENVEEAMLVFRTSTSTLWIGKSSGITAASEGIFPILKDEFIGLNLKKGNNNNLYGISSSGNIDVYVFGVINE